MPQPVSRDPRQLSLGLAPARDLLTRLRAAGLPPRFSVAFHANRSTMVSIGRGRTLRVHQGYGYAPDHTIRAIVEWALAGRTAREGRAATRVLLAFPADRHVVPTAARPRRPDRGEPGDGARLARLRVLHAELNVRHFSGALGPVRLALSSRMRRKLGHFEPSGRLTEPGLIVIGRRHLRQDGWGSVTVTLLHEMVHQWQAERRLALDHGATFRRKARAVGISPRATTSPCGQ